MINNKVMVSKKINKKNDLSTIVDKINKFGFIYLTEEVDENGVVQKHNGMNKLGIGRTKDNERRVKEHHYNRGSKSTVGVYFMKIIDCDEVGFQDEKIEKDLHKLVLSLGFYRLKRISFLIDEKIESDTEVFSGLCNRTIEGVCKEGEELTEDLVLRLIKNLYNIDLFKEQLNLLPHQEIAYSTMMDAFNNKGYKEFLLNHKPRSGKSFICYHYMIEEPQDVLLFTNFPVLNGQWKSEFEKLRNHNYNIIIANKIEDAYIKLDKDKPNFVLISLQDGKGVDVNSDDEIVNGLNKKKFKYIKKHNWGTIIFDEIHKGKETPKTDRLLSGIKYNRMIGLSATPTKNILRGTFTMENTHRYTLVDEMLYKQKYPELYKNPTIKHYLFNIGDDVRENMKYFDENENLTFKKLLEVSNDGLVYKNDLITLFSWLFSRCRYNRKTNPTHSLMNKTNSLLLFVENNISEEYVSNILNDLVGDIYDIHYTNSEINGSDRLLHKIKNDYLPKNGKKSIIIANKQLTTGITLKLCDMVIFMNDWKSVDDYVQAMYRCQTVSDGKDECYVVDLNPGRAYNIIYNYIESNNSYKKYDIKDSIKEYLDCVPTYENLDNNLKEIDYDYFNARLVDNSKVEDDFFKSKYFVYYDKIGDYKDMLSKLELGDIDDGEMVNMKTVQLDESQPSSGKNFESVEKQKVDEIRNSDEYKEEYDKYIKEVDYLIERLSLLSLLNGFNYDNLDAVFNNMDQNPELIRDYIQGLLIE